MIEITNPQPIFLDARGALSDGGYIYVGDANSDPETSPLTVYFDTGMTIAAPQPLRTVGGVIVNGSSPAQIYCGSDSYSIRLRDSDGVQSLYLPSVFNQGDAYQPADLDLTAIAKLGTTEFGRSLLTLVNQAALQAIIGYYPSLSLNGGIMLGGIVRQGAGVYPYFADGDILGGRIFITPASAADPTSQPGDMWFQY